MLFIIFILIFVILLNGITEFSYITYINDFSIKEITNNQITPDEGSWSNTIKTLFIFTIGGLNYYIVLKSGGRPLQRFGIIITTILFRFRN